MADVLARTVSDEVWAILEAITGVNAFDGDVDIPAYDAGKPETHRFWDLDMSGHPENVHAYLVFHPSPGRPFSDRLSGSSSKFAWTFQVTCVGGDRERCLWCVDRVRPVLARRLISIGRIRELGGNESRLPVVDRDVVPTRRYVPLDFGVHALG